jgi:transposase
LQINIGLLVNREGLPLAHKVSKGSEPDKSTVANSLKTLSQRFRIKRCVYVGDREMLTDDNIKTIIRAGLTYILGFHKRGRLLSDYLLEQYQNLDDYSTIYGDDEEDRLKYLEVTLPVSTSDESEADNDQPGMRYILCYKPAKARDDREYRETALQEVCNELQQLSEQIASDTSHRGRKITAKGIMKKVTKILDRKHMARFFNIGYEGTTLSFNLIEAELAKEPLRDGKFLIKTNIALSVADVIQSYKNLMMVENAFKEIKNLVKLRPIYHYNEQRVRAYVLICVLATCSSNGWRCYTGVTSRVKHSRCKRLSTLSYVRKHWLGSIVREKPDGRF